LLEGKLLHAVVQKNRGKQYNAVNCECMCGNVMNILTSFIVKASDRGCLKFREEPAVTLRSDTWSHLSPNNKVYSVYI
jgi:hypothetical protein